MTRRHDRLSKFQQCPWEKVGRRQLRIEVTADPLPLLHTVRQDWMCPDWPWLCREEVGA